MKRVFLSSAALSTMLATAAIAQSPTPTPIPTTVASGVTHATEGTARVNGVRIDPQPDGSVWFLEATADRIGVLRGSTITYWQLRASNQIGANPVDFEIDGNTVWFIESGESQIPAGTSAFASLDTTTGALTEWVIPGAIPAAFYRAPDGKVWLPQTNGRLQSFDPATLQVLDYRSMQTFAYADMVVGPDGALWLTDFGDNRIVRYMPGEATESSWTFFNPAAGRLNPSHMAFDEHGFLWISQVSVDRVDRFDPSTGGLLSYPGINNPVHFDIFQGRLYVTSAQSQSSVSVLDPALALSLGQVLTKVTNDVASVPNAKAVTIRTATITPTTFDAPAAAISASDLTASSTIPGILATNFPSTNTYGIAVAGGSVWVGTDGKLANLVLQTIGTPTDQSVPVATALAGSANSKIRIDITLSNLGTSAISGDALYLYSPGSFAARVAFTLAPGETQFLPDAFGNIGASTQLLNGPVRLRVSTGDPADLFATVRSTRVLPDGRSFGYALPATPVSGTLAAGSVATLFTGSRDSEASILGLFAPGGASGTLTLVSPDGSIRGVRAFDLAIDTHEEFNPAASAFGVDTESGDVVRISVSTGSIQAYVDILDLGSRDVAVSLPVAATTDAVVPNAGAVVGVGDKSFVSDLFLSNPDAEATAEISLAYYPLAVSGAPAQATLSLAPQESRTVADFLPSLFGIDSGQGALLITSSAPVASAVRIAARSPTGDYAGFAPALDGKTGLDGASAVAIGLPQTATRRTNLLLYNRGMAGEVTVTGFLPDGSEAGHLSVPLGDHTAGRLNYVFSAFGITDQAAGRIRVDVPDGMNVYAWTAEVDGPSGDIDIAPLR